MCIRDSYEPHSTKKTISNAMDVSDPSNFIRIQKIFNSDLQRLRKNVSSFSFNDTETEDVMRLLYNSFDYLTCPHSAVGYLGLKKYMDVNKILLGYWSTKGLGSASRQMVIYAGIPLISKIYRLIPKLENNSKLMMVVNGTIKIKLF